MSISSVFLFIMENDNQKSEWFEEWFNTPFYHILYKNRNEKEAELFVSNLVSALHIKKSAHLLDLACGKGRHSVYLNKLGFNVVGADLSVNSIADAKKHENDNLRFIVHDMREAIPKMKFDFILNLFTSFGYFDTQEDNLKVLKACHQMLNDNGRLVIDFLNLERVINDMQKEEVKHVDGIDFHITRKFDGYHIYKTISFGHTGQTYSYTERVQGLRKEDFEKLLTAAGFSIDAFYGNFELIPFNAATADRLIIFATKK